MAFTDLLNSIFERMLEKGEVANQGDFADFLGMSRPRVNQFLGGLVPPDNTILAILTKTNSKLADCLDAPEAIRRRGEAIEAVDDILKRRDQASVDLEDAIKWVQWKAQNGSYGTKERKGMVAKHERKKAAGERRTS